MYMAHRISAKLQRKDYLKLKKTYVFGQRSYVDTSLWKNDTAML